MAKRHLGQPVSMEEVEVGLPGHTATLTYSEVTGPPISGTFILKDTSSGEVLAQFSTAGDGSPTSSILGRLFLTGISDSEDILKFLGVGGDSTDVGIRVYSVKGTSFFEIWIDGVLALSMSGFTGPTFSDITVSGPASFSGAVRTTGVTNASINGTVNDLNVGNPPSSNVRLTGGISPVLTGMANFMAYQRITLFNVGSNNISLSHDSAGSSAANRFYCPGSTTFVLRPNAAIDVYRDTSTNRLRLIAQ